MNNRRTLELIHGAAEDAKAKANSQWYQAHKDWKHDYNVKYYREHKDQWAKYNARKVAATNINLNLHGRLQSALKDLQSARSAMKDLNRPKGATREKNVDGTASISTRDARRWVSPVNTASSGLRSESAESKALRSAKTGQQSAVRPYTEAVAKKKYWDSVFKEQHEIAMSKKGALNRKESLATKAKREASMLGSEIAKSAKKAVAPVAALAPDSKTVARFVRSIIEAPSKYGTNWKSGAKDIISKGKSLTSKIGNLFSKPVKQAVLDYKGGTEKILTEKILTEKIIRE